MWAHDCLESFVPDLTKILVDHRWLLVGIRTERYVVEVKSSLCEAWIDLYADGVIRYDDGLNAHSGRFELVTEGLLLFDIVTTSKGYAGGDPQRLATLKAFHQLPVASRRRTEPDQPDEATGLDRPDVVVGVSVVDSLLHLATADSTLMFRRTGRVYRAF